MEARRAWRSSRQALDVARCGGPNRTPGSDPRSNSASRSERETPEFKRDGVLNVIRITRVSALRGRPQRLRNQGLMASVPRSGARGALAEGDVLQPTTRSEVDGLLLDTADRHRIPGEVHTHGHPHDRAQRKAATEVVPGLS